ncbi:MAG TPA: phosphatidate cytidylyltransferase [Acidimicrobiia bacterium]|nr:phosphatidate cytidylyltransferase [Acidimicrobiia bacterium]
MTERDRPDGEETEAIDSTTSEELPFSPNDADDADDATEAGRDQPAANTERPVEVDDGGPDWEGMSEDPAELDFTSAEYLKGTTQEYQGLAEEVQRASTEEWELQAVAANLPGVESGLVGFGDVSGTQTESEESYEAAEQAASSDLAMRVGSAVVIFGLFVGSLLLGGWWFTIFVILLMVVATGEFYATLRTRGYRPLALFGLLGVVLMGVGAHNAGPMAIAGWFAALFGATILFFSLAPRRYALANTSVTVFGMAWVGLLAFAILIAEGPHPVAHIFFLVIVIATNDIGAYFVGRSLGRRPLASVISPAKTVEGLIGGLLIGGVVAAVLAVFPPWEEIGIERALIAAVIIGVLVPIGDLAESMVKRSLGVKDMGSVLPGHGGMLDRIDGFLFAVPAVYILFRGFGLL